MSAGGPSSGRTLHPMNASPDRLDHTKGYVRGNVRLGRAEEEHAATEKRCAESGQVGCEVKTCSLTVKAVWAGYNRFIDVTGAVFAATARATTTWTASASCTRRSTSSRTTASTAGACSSGSLRSPTASLTNATVIMPSPLQQYEAGASKQFGAMKTEISERKKSRDKQQTTIDALQKDKALIDHIKRQYDFYKDTLSGHIKARQELEQQIKEQASTIETLKTQAEKADQARDWVKMLWTSVAKHQEETAGDQTPLDEIVQMFAEKLGVDLPARAQAPRTAPRARPASTSRIPVPTTPRSRAAASASTNASRRAESEAAGGEGASRGASGASGGSAAPPWRLPRAVTPASPSRRGVTSTSPARRAAMPALKRPAPFSSSSSPTPAQVTQVASLFESQESRFPPSAGTAGSPAADVDTPLSIRTAMRRASVSQGPASSLALTAATAGSSVEGSASQAAESSALSKSMYVVTGPPSASAHRSSASPTSPHTPRSGASTTSRRPTPSDPRPSPAGSPGSSGSNTSPISAAELLSEEEIDAKLSPPSSPLSDSSKIPDIVLKSGHLFLNTNYINCVDAALPTNVRSLRDEDTPLNPQPVHGRYAIVRCHTNHFYDVGGR